MTSNKAVSKSRINWKMFRWGLLGMVAPAITAIFMALVLIPQTRWPFEVALPVMMALGAIGAAIHYLTFKRPPKVRIFAHTVFALALVFAGFFAWKSFSIPHEFLITCPVCGFRTLEAQEETCAVCKVLVSEASAKLEDFASIEELIFAEQLIYFLPSDEFTGIDFYAADVSDNGYQKDSRWKPKVTIADISDVQNLLDKEYNDSSN